MAADFDPQLHGPLVPVLKANDSRMGANPDAPFVSPFPSNDANLSGVFGGLIDSVNALPGADEDGVTAALQAKAWTRAQRRSMFDRATSKRAGGIRLDWLPKVASIAKSGAVKGIFANVTFAPKTSTSAAESSIAEVGLDVGISILTSVPLYGNILKAAIGVGKFFAGLMRKPEPEQALEVPWQKYSKSVDEDVVNIFLSSVMSNVDWTSAFSPALDPASGFTLERTDKGDLTRAWGVFSPGGTPVDGGGTGMLPGMERLTQTVQVATVALTAGYRRDAVTDVGSFWPATSEYLTGAWGMVDKQGNPDMFKVRASELREKWDAYWEAFWESAWDQWGRLDDTGRVYLSKALAPFIYVQTDSPDAPKSYYAKLDFSTFTQPFITPEVFDEGWDPKPRYYKPLNELWVRPALTRLMKRQRAALSYSVVSGLVRPEELAPNEPAWAAFLDTGPALKRARFDTFGAELLAKCLDMRERLLNSPARYELSSMGQTAPDVRVVDPPYADKLEATLTPQLFISAREPVELERGAFKGPDAQPPGGGAPWGLPAGETTTKYILPIAAALGVAGGIAGALYLEDLLPWQS